MDKLTSLCYLFLISSLIFCCAQPTDFEGGKFVAHTPEDVVANLSQAYEEKNLDGYLSMLSEDCRFLDGGDYLWGKMQEHKIHKSMFAAAKTIDLKLTEGWNDEATETTRRTVYHYYLQVQLPGEPLEAQGQVELVLAKNTSDTWQVSSFRDLKTDLHKPASVASNTLAVNNSGDYFPLRVGNTWLYKNTFITTFPETLRTTVTDSLVIRGNKYYRVKNLLYLAFELNRLDSLRLKTFIEEDSTELIVLDFNVSIGDTLVFTLPHLPGPFIVELLTEKDSVTVPAGTFRNIKEFLITDFNSGSRFLYEFADGVGLIRQRGTNTVNELISAKVNDVVVSVKTPYFNWTQIKISFN